MHQTGRRELISARKRLSRGEPGSQGGLGLHRKIGRAPDGARPVQLKRSGQIFTLSRLEGRVTIGSIYPVCIGQRGCDRPPFWLRLAIRLGF